MIAGHCKECRRTIGGLIALALMEDAGAKVYPSATHCYAGKEHEFAFPKPVDTKAA